VENLAIKRRTKPKLAFTLLDSERAFDSWGANCGPQALAAALNLSLGEVKRAVIESFKGWMNPTQMANALGHFGVKFDVEKTLRTRELRNGIGYIQWDGRWVTNKFKQERYHYTHWIAARDGWVFDLNAIEFGWLCEADWRMDIDQFVKNAGYKGWFFWQWLEF
jgi:hypothetical protein